MIKIINEFYFYQPENGWGSEITFGDIQNRFKSSTPMGIHNSKGEIILNPNKEMLIGEDDELIFEKIYLYQYP